MLAMPDNDPLQSVTVDQVAEEMSGQEMMYNEFLADLDGVSSQALDYVAGQVDGQVSALESVNTESLADLENKVYDPVCDLSGKCIDAEDYIKSQTVTPLATVPAPTATGPFGFSLVTIPGDYPCAIVQYNPSRIYNNISSVYHKNSPYTTSIIQPFVNYWCQSYWPASFVKPIGERSPNEGWYLFVMKSVYTGLRDGSRDVSFWPTAFCWVYLWDLKNEFTDTSGNVGFNIPPDTEGFSLFSSTKFDEMVPVENVSGLSGVAPPSKVCGCDGGTENTTNPPPTEPAPSNPPQTPSPTQTPPIPTPSPSPSPSPSPVTTPCPSSGVVTVKCPECKCNVHIDPIEIKPIYPAPAAGGISPAPAAEKPEPIPVGWDNWQYLVGRSKGLPWMQEALRLLPAQVRTALDNGRPEVIAQIMFNQGLAEVTEDQPLITPAQARNL